MDEGIIITQGPSPSFLHLLEAAPSPSVRLTQVVASSLGMRSSQLPSHLVYFIPSQPRLSLGIPRNPYTWLFLGREIFLPQLIHHPAHKLLLPQQARGALLAVPPKNKHGNVFPECPGSSFFFSQGAQLGMPQLQGEGTQPFTTLASPLPQLCWSLSASGV